MTLPYLRTWVACLVVSIVLNILVSLSQLSSWLVLLPITPLLYYHWCFLKPKATHGLPAVAIDSVYYLGFLVTIVALAISGLTLAGSDLKAEKLQEVGVQFGVGILATGYAVFARVHLTAISSGVVPNMSPEESIDRVADKTFQLGVNIEALASSFEDFANRLQQKTFETIDAAASSHAQSLAAMTNQMDADLARIREVVGDDGIRKDVVAFGSSIAKVSSGAEALAKTLTTLVEARSCETEASIQITIRTQALCNNLTSLNQSLESIGNASGIAGRAAESVKLFSASMQAHNQVLSQSVADLNQIREEVASAVPTFKQIRAVSREVGEQADSLGSAVKGLETTLLQVNQLATGVGGLTNELGMVSIATAEFNTRLQQLSAKTASFTSELLSSPAPGKLLYEDFDRWRRALDEDLMRSTKSVAMLQDKLIELSEFLIQRHQEVAKRASSNG